MHRSLKTVRCPPFRAIRCKFWNEPNRSETEVIMDTPGILVTGSKFITHELKPNQVYMIMNWMYINQGTRWNVYDVHAFGVDETLPFIDINGNVLYIRPHDLSMSNRGVKEHYHPSKFS